MVNVVVEKIIIVGAPSTWASKDHVEVEQDGKKIDVTIEYHGAEGGKAAWAMVKNPKVRIGADWEVDFTVDKSEL